MGNYLQKLVWEISSKEAAMVTAGDLPKPVWDVLSLNEPIQALKCDSQPIRPEASPLHLVAQ